jgi:hypothetical protein
MRPLLFSTTRRAGFSCASSTLAAINSALTFPLAQDEGHGVIALSYSLRAFHASTTNSFEPLRLRCICQVAQCRLAISPTVDEASRGLLELEAAWDKILAREKVDAELMASACEVRGRAGVYKAEGRGERQRPRRAKLSR